MPSSRFKSPAGVSDALFTGEALFARKPVTDDFFFEDLLNTDADSRRMKFQLGASDVGKTLAGATEAADFSLDLDAMAPGAFPEVLPEVSHGKKMSAPSPAPKPALAPKSAAKASASDSNVLGVLNRWIDGLSESGIGSSAMSDNSSNATFATDMPSQQSTTTASAARKADSVSEWMPKLSLPWTNGLMPCRNQAWTALVRMTQHLTLTLLTLGPRLSQIWLL